MSLCTSKQCLVAFTFFIRIVIDFVNIVVVGKMMIK